MLQTYIFILHKVFLDVPLGSLQSCDCLIKNGDSWMDVA